VAERRGSGLQSRVHGFESRLHLDHNFMHNQQYPNGRLAQGLARFLDTEEVTGSIPVSPTITPGRSVQTDLSPFVGGVVHPERRHKRTSIFPVFAPLNSRMSASGADSNPSRTSTLYVILPSNSQVARS
jgi:hypothetical protein